MGGWSKIAKKLQRKQKNVVDENVVKLKELKEQEKAERESKREDEEATTVLKRFFWGYLAQTLY